MNLLSQLLHRLHYMIRYYQNPRWDTGISPPELMTFIDQHQPGKALDLGCGTGTNLVNLAKHGWEVFGIDFVPKAVRAARAKLDKENLEGSIILGDVLKKYPLPNDFDLVLDIGCFHSQQPQSRNLYLHNVYESLKPGGYYLLYAHTTFDGKGDHGIQRRDVDMLNDFFKCKALNETEEKREGQFSHSRPSLWALYTKTTD